MPNDRLTCEYLDAPLGLSTRVPRFAWVLDRPRRGFSQSAWQVLVAERPDELAAGRGGCWDSGKVDSAACVQVAYAGAPLAADRTYHWMVRVWDENGVPGGWSAPTTFDTGLLDERDWAGAAWIARRPEAEWRAAWDERKRQENSVPYTGRPRHPLKNGGDRTLWELQALPSVPYDPAPLLRTEFAVAKAVRRARLYACGLGYAELHLNGQRVGDHQLDPGWTPYHRGALYVTHDVTALLRAGANCVGALLGRGFFNMIANDVFGMVASPWSAQPKLRLLLTIDHDDGSRSIVGSGPGWTAGAGQVVFDCPRLGEILDGRAVQPGWDAPGFATSAAGGWAPAQVAPAPTSDLRAQAMAAVRAVRTVKAETVRFPAPGVAVVTFPENLAGWVRLRLRGPAGTRVLVHFAERAEDDTFWDLGTNGFQQFGYVLRGDGEEVAEARFSYHGFQAVRIDGLPGAFTLDDIEAVHVHTDVAAAGSFACADPLLNRIDAACRLTQLNNLHSIPTDCPHREKLGWLFDCYAASEGLIHHFDMAAFYANFVRNIADSQNAAGQLPLFVPSNACEGVSPLWSAVFVLLPWYLYRYYGDTRVLATHYDAFVRFAESIPARNQAKGEPADIIDDVLSDWISPTSYIVQPAEGGRVYSTAFYFLVVARLADIARVLGRDADAQRFRAWSERIRAAWHLRFYDAAAHAYRGQNPTPYRQAPNAVALAAGLVPDGERAAVLAGLVDDITAACHDHLSTGLVGTTELLHALPAAGRLDVAHKVVAQTSFPSWGQMLLMGRGTTIWEDWWGSNSQDHPMLTSVGAFLVRDLVGIQDDPEVPAYRRIVLRPGVVDGLAWAGATYTSIRGRIALRWERSGTTLTVDATVPPSTNATLHLPVADPVKALVHESGTLLWDGARFTPVEGVQGARPDPDHPALIITLGAGTYRFVVG